MENWGVYAKPYVPCPWIIKLVLLEQRDLWRLLVLQVCRKQDYIQQLHPAAPLLLRLILCISISRKQNLVQHYLIWSQPLILFIFHFHRNNYFHSLFWIHIRAAPIGRFELPIPSCVGLQRHNVHFYFLFFFVSASASKITFFIYLWFIAAFLKEDGSWRFIWLSKALATKIPSQAEQGLAPVLRGWGKLPAPGPAQGGGLHITSGWVKQSPNTK